MPSHARISWENLPPHIKIQRRSAHAYVIYISISNCRRVIKNGKKVGAQQPPGRRCAPVAGAPPMYLYIMFFFFGARLIPCAAVRGETLAHRTRKSFACVFLSSPRSCPTRSSSRGRARGQLDVIKYTSEVVSCTCARVWEWFMQEKKLAFFQQIGKL